MRLRTVGLIVRCAIVVSVAAGMLAAPFLAASQPPQKLFRVGHLSAGGRTPDGAPPGPLRESLRGLGYVEGQNVAYEARFAEGKVERLPGLAADLVRLKIDVIVAQGGPAAEAAKRCVTQERVAFLGVKMSAISPGGGSWPKGSSGRG